MVKNNNKKDERSTENLIVNKLIGDKQPHRNKESQSVALLRYIARSYNVS